MAAAVEVQEELDLEQQPYHQILIQLLLVQVEEVPYLAANPKLLDLHLAAEHLVSQALELEEMLVLH